MRIKDYLENHTWCNCEYYNIDVSEALRRNGVKVEAFGTRDPSDLTNGFNANFTRARFFGDFLRGNDVEPEKYSDWEKELLPRFMMLLDALGSFKDSKNCFRRWSALAYGEIQFPSISPRGYVAQRIVRFSTEVPLLIGGQYVAAAQSSYQYDAKLDVDKENYKVVVKGRRC
ncbi:MAG: hypothetical protein HC769_28580 [Cyanobacteria bacterium CRU_2_1]|nr:hypothetical protein [Cyanobacteria bacterium CRU_2_1]